MYTTQFSQNDIKNTSSVRFRVPGPLESDALLVVNGVYFELDFENVEESKEHLTYIYKWTINRGVLNSEWNRTMTTRAGCTAIGFNRAIHFIIGQNVDGNPIYIEEEPNMLIYVMHEGHPTEVELEKID